MTCTSNLKMFYYSLQRSEFLWSRSEHSVSCSESSCGAAPRVLVELLELIQINSDPIPIEGETTHRFVPFIRVLQGQSNNNGFRGRN